MITTEYSAILSSPITPGRDHIRGPITASVNLVEYGDFECPYCRAAHGVVTALQEQLQSGLCFVYRHFPLTTVHPHAAVAAEAAEAAGEQDQFWAMHDRLFTARPPLTRDVLLSNASEIGLDLQRFDNALQSHTYLPRIRDDLMSGVRSGVNGTPTFYINGYRHDGGWDTASLLAALVRAARTGATID